MRCGRLDVRRVAGDRDAVDVAIDAVRSPASRDQPPCERRLGDLNVRGSSGLMSWRLRLTTSAACDLAGWRTRYADGKRSHAELSGFGRRRQVQGDGRVGPIGSSFDDAGNILGRSRR